MGRQVARMFPSHALSPSVPLSIVLLQVAGFSFGVQMETCNMKRWWTIAEHHRLVDGNYDGSTPKCREPAEA